MAEPQPPPPAQSPRFSVNELQEAPPRPPAMPLDFNIAVIIAAMVCALLCALGLNSMLQCVLQCSHRTVTGPVEWAASRRLNSGLKKKDVMALPTSTYANSGSPASLSCTCAICLVDFSEGDSLRVLPKCNHRFHVACIDKWLLSHSSCPTCRLDLKSTDCFPSYLV